LCHSRILLSNDSSVGCDASPSKTYGYAAALRDGRLVWDYRKTRITAADLLNDRVLPFYEEHDIPSIHGW